MDEKKMRSREGVRKLLFFKKKIKIMDIGSANKELERIDWVLRKEVPK